MSRQRLEMLDRGVHRLLLDLVLCHERVVRFRKHGWINKAW
jgi:hypothetical protein